MPRYIIQPQLVTLKEKYELIKVEKRKMRGEKDAYEHEKLLASYFIIEVCSGFEYALKSLIENLLKNKGLPLTIQSYVIASHPLKSANYSDLCELLGKFDGRAREGFKRRINERERDALQSLYWNRQKIAHSSGSQEITVTFGDVEGWYKQAMRVIKKFETVFRRLI